MPSTYSCPNPRCTHVFSTDELKGASRLVCPQCGSAFQLRRVASASAAKSGAINKPEAAVPPPLPSVPPPLPAVAPVVPPALPSPLEAEMVPAESAQPQEDLHFPTTSEIVAPPVRRRRVTRRTRRLAPLLALLTIAVLGIGAALWAGLWILYFNKADKAQEDALRGASAFNFAFTPPGKPWQRDKDIEFQLHVNFGMRSVESNHCLGLAFKDYKTREPSQAELVEAARSKLRAYFKGVEWEEPKEDNAQLGGRPALVLVFEGEDAEHVPIRGECYMLTFRGFAYWFFTWAPAEDKDQASAEGEKLRQQFLLLDGRKGWTGKPRATETVKGNKANYRLTYMKDLWTRKNASDYDPLADLALQGAEPDNKYASQTATFQVLVLPKEADLEAAVAAARAYVQMRQKELYTKIEMQVMKDKEGTALDGPAEIGNVEGQLIKLHLQIDEVERFMILAVVNRSEGVLVLQAECQWNRRDFWDQEFMPLLKSLRVR